MRGKLLKKIKAENGAVQIVESTIVFPVMFIILFFLIYMGNAYYMKAQIESVVMQKAIEGASYCADPLLETIKSGNGSIPKVDQIDIKPYRYIFGGVGEIENKIGGDVYSSINSSDASFFRNMNPVVKTPKSDIAKYHNYVLYSTFSVDLECRVEFPIKFLGSSTPYVMIFNSHAEVAVNDTAEFIRNTDLVIDYFEDSKLGQSIKGVFEKINTFIENFAGK